MPHKGTSTVYESSSAIQHGKTARCLSVEASWDGDVLGRWTLSAGERLRAGPEPENELLVAETLMPKGRPLIALDGYGRGYELHVPPSALVQDAVGPQRDAYRQAAWRHIAERPQRVDLENPVDIHLGPWHLRLRPSDAPPLLPGGRRASKKPVAALIASALVHALLIAVALAKPPSKVPLPHVTTPAQEPTVMGCGRSWTKPMPRLVCLSPFGWRSERRETELLGHVLERHRQGTDAERCLTLGCALGDALTLVVRYDARGLRRIWSAGCASSPLVRACVESVTPAETLDPELQGGTLVDRQEPLPRLHRRRCYGP